MRNLHILLHIRFYHVGNELKLEHLFIYLINLYLQKTLENI